jgi:integrase
VFYWDTVTKGFGVRVSRSKKAYVAQGRASGKSVTVTLIRADLTTTDGARKLAVAALGKLAGGINVNSEKRTAKVRGESLETVFKEFRKARGPSLKPRTLAEYERILGIRRVDGEVGRGALFKDWLDQPWTSITSGKVVKRHAYIGEHHGQRSANNAMRVLRSVLSFARATYAEALADRPDLLKCPVKILSEQDSWFAEKPRTDFLKASALTAWWKAVDDECTEVQADYLKCLLLTGARGSELAHLKWTDVDVHEGAVVFRDTKNGTDLRIPVSDHVHDILRRREKVATSDYVFPALGRGKAADGDGHLSCVNRALHRVTKRAGVSMATRHGLRRTFVSVAVDLDINPYTIKKLVNHKLSSANDVTAGYVQFDVEKLRIPVQRISDWILKAAGQKETAQVVPIKAAASA